MGQAVGPRVARSAAGRCDAAERSKAMADRDVATIDTFAVDQRKARAYAESTLVPEHLRGNFANCLAAMMMADEMGESRLAVMQNIYFVHGRPAWLASFMIARANRSGKFIGPLRWRATGTWPDIAMECYAYLRDAPQDDCTVAMTVSMKTARESGWTTYKDKAGKEQMHARWQTPDLAALMLQYRSASWLIRLYAPECMMGLPTKEELEDISGREMVDVTPAAPPKLEDFAPNAKADKADKQPGGFSDLEQE